MRLLIWDFDGTLGYRVGGSWACTMLELLREEMPELDVSAGDLQPYLQSGFLWHTPDQPHPQIRTADAWWEALTPVLESAFQSIGVDARQAQSLARRVRDTYTDPTRWRLFDQALATLDGLSVRGWTHVLLSNHTPELRDIVDYLRLAPRLARIFNSAETGYEKPHPGAFGMVLDGFPHTTAVWMIGDSIRIDVAGAEAVGIPAMLVHHARGEVELVCPTLSDVEAVLTEEQ